MKESNDKISNLLLKNNTYVLFLLNLRKQFKDKEKNSFDRSSKYYFRDLVNKIEEILEMSKWYYDFCYRKRYYI